MLKLIIKVAVVLMLMNSTVAAKEFVNVDLNASKYVNVGMMITRITSGNPQIAVVKQVDSTLKTGFLVEGHSAGTTAVLVWTLDGQIREYMVVVSPEDEGQALLIQRAIGLPNVHVKKIGQKVLLMGTVKNQYERNMAIQITSFYLNGNPDVSISTGSNGSLELETQSATSTSGDDIDPSKIETGGSIIDLLKMTHPTQIKFEAQVIDINSNESKNLGFQYGSGSGSGAAISISPGSLYAGESMGRGGYSNNPIKWFDRHRSTLAMSIQALVENGKARILSRPSLTTMSGEQATIQIGGRIPYRSVNSNGSSNTQFEDYGIILQCKPIVDADNRITVAVHAEVSNLSGQSVEGQPIISTRHAEAVINLDSGASMLIGGLMYSSETKSLQKIPLLGNIPILGEFFKYSYKSRNKRELIIIVTPTVLESTDSAEMTNEMTDFYEQGNLEAQNRQHVSLNPPPLTITQPFEEERK